MKNKFKVILYYLLITFNTFVFAVEKNDANILKIGVLTPMSGEMKNLGEELLYAINLALHDINNKNIKIYPKDSGSNREVLIKSCEEFEKEGIKIIIGLFDSKYSNEIYKFKNLTFVSLSNIDSSIKENILMVGINLESQLLAIKKFIKNQKKNKTVILFPKNEYSKHVEKNIKLIDFSNSRVFKYDKDPKILTRQIEKLTNYKQRKKNLESRIKKLEKSEEPKDLRELTKLKQRYTLGKINFDSIVIIDFGDSLKSVLTSLAYTDVSEKDVLIITGNQWFDSTILEESSIKSFYFPSVNLKNFKKFNENFNQSYGYKPNEITILAYDSIGLIYYIWSKKGKIDSVNSFVFKNEIKGKIGKFKISEDKVLQKLNIYKLEEGNFIKNNL
tara:strand:- start:1279 stop:2442 length:1164 start_codon:yes stop_codon:yes gene_type:complete